MSHKRNPLEIPEIIRLVGRFVEESSLLEVMKVSKTFHGEFAATAWETIVVDFSKRDLYSHTPSHSVYEYSGSKLVPWESLKTYGPHVCNIQLLWYYYRPNEQPVALYPRPVSVAELLTMLGGLPFVKSMTVDINNVDIDNVRQLFHICSHLKSLRMKKCRMSTDSVPKHVRGSKLNWLWQAQALVHPSEYDLEELTISTSCGVGLKEFLSRSPRLRILTICYGDGSDSFEDENLYDLVTFFGEKDSLPKLQHVDICIPDGLPGIGKNSSRTCRVNAEVIWKILKSVRCLRIFQCRQGNAMASTVDLRPHFSTITTIDVLSATSEFWKEVMSSCPALVTAKEVKLFAEDITEEEKWASTGIESLDVIIFAKRYGKVRSRRKVREDALFQRIAKLVKLKHLSVISDWELSLDDQSLEALMGIKTLKSINLGYQLEATGDVPQFLKRFSDNRRS